MIKSIVNIEGLGNRRVIDFLKHSSNFGLPGLDFKAPSEGRFGAPSVQNIVIHNVFVHFCFDFAPKPCFLQHSVGSEGARLGGRRVRGEGAK